MKKNKITASVLSASLLATPIIAQIGTLNVFAQEGAENTNQVEYWANADCVTGKTVTTGLSLLIQNQGGGDYKNCGVKIYKISDDDVISGEKQNSKINGVDASNYDLNSAKLVTTFHTICFEDQIWVNNGQTVVKDGNLYTGRPTFRTLEAGKYILVYDGNMSGFAAGIGMDFFGFNSNETYQRIPFTVSDGVITNIDVEESNKAKLEIDKADTGNVELQAIVVETDKDGNVLKDTNGNYIPTGEKVENVAVNPEENDMYLTDEIVKATVSQMGGIMTEEQVVSSLITLGYTDVRGLSLKTDSNGLAKASDVTVGKVNMITTIPEGYSMVEPNIDSTFVYDIAKGETVTKVIELYKTPEIDDDDPTIPIEVPQGIRVLVKDRATNEDVEGAIFKVVAKNDTTFTFSDTSIINGVIKTTVKPDTYTASLLFVPNGYKLNTETSSITLEPVTKNGVVTDMILYVDKDIPVEDGDLDIIVRDKNTKDPIPNATVEILDKDGKVIDTVKTDNNGKIEKDKLPVGDYTIKVIEVPDGYNIPDNQKVTVEKDKTTTVIFELEKKTTPKTGDNSHVFTFIGTGIAAISGMFLSLKKKKK